MRKQGFLLDKYSQAEADNFPDKFYYIYQFLKTIEWTHKKIQFQPIMAR